MLWGPGVMGAGGEAIAYFSELLCWVKENTRFLKKGCGNDFSACSGSANCAVSKAGGQLRDVVAVVASPRVGWLMDGVLSSLSRWRRKLFAFRVCLCFTPTQCASVGCR